MAKTNNYHQNEWWKWEESTYKKKRRYYAELVDMECPEKTKEEKREIVNRMMRIEHEEARAESERAEDYAMTKYADQLKEYGI